MDSFESLMAMLLTHDGYWTATSVKINLTPDDKCKLGRKSCPRWEVDVVGYKASTNEVLIVECKSYLDSTGVIFRNGKFESSKNRYKLFSEENTRNIVLERLKEELIQSGHCRHDPTMTLCLAAGRIAKKTDRVQMEGHFTANKWRLFDEVWAKQRLHTIAERSFENDVAHIVAKLLLRK